MKTHSIRAFSKILQPLGNNGKRSGLFGLWLRFGSVTGSFEPAPSPKPLQNAKNPRSEWLQNFFKRSRIQTAPDVDVFPQDVPVRRVRNGASLISSADLATDCRAYLRGLRAAEMAAWEETGGDYLRSDYVARG